MSTDLARRITDFGQPRVLVVGDLILDRYVFGSVDRVSPEAPIQVLAVQREENRVGGAANVARNLHALGAHVDVVGVVGEDEQGERLVSALATLGPDAGARIDTSGILRDASRPTIEKTRMVASAQQVLRVDREDVRALSGDVEGELGRVLEERIGRADLVVLSDYGKGTLTDGILRTVIERARAADRRVVVDPKGRDFAKYRGASILTPNRLEAERVTGLALDDDAKLAEAGASLVNELDLEAAMITLGAGGIYAHPRDAGAIRVAARARAVYDVTGAGDTVVAILALSLAAGASLEEAIQLANEGAGIVVGKVGTAVVTRAEVVARLLEGSPFHTAKERPLEDLALHLDDLRSSGRRIVFTNGCFDLIHAGHIHYLDFARSQGDCLVVGVNSDQSVRDLKGEGRPIQSVRERLQVLGALEMIDFLVTFETSTPLALIERIRPDVLVKGEDWREKGVVGREFVESYGGQVVLAPLVAGQSTTSIVDRILACHDRSSDPA